MIQQTILTNLVNRQDYMRKVLPHLKGEYFQDRADKTVYETIADYVDRYNSPPSVETLKIELGQKEGIDEQTYSRCMEIVEDIQKFEESTDPAWLMDQTESFCQDSAIYNGIQTAVQILSGEHKSLDKGMIPKLLQDALSVSFDNAIGHDFLDDWEARFEFYNTFEKKIPFDIKLLNKITNGGIYRKTLTVLLAGTGVGKTLAMCHFAANNLASGLNVLYITNEMAEERIAERIDANLMNVTIDELHGLPKNIFQSKIEKIKQTARGRLVIKEYPTSSAGAANFRHLLNELKLKKKFVPDVIYVDYLNICISNRMRMGGSVNSYTYIKAIAEELRGLAVEFNVPIITATQLNREGFVNSDPGLENTSESFGLPATADLMLAMVQTEELANLGQIMFKQLKNRYRDINMDMRFVVGVDKPKMRLFDLDMKAQKNIMGNNNPVVVQTTQKFSKDKFADFS